MVDPITFPSRTDGLGLPLLFAGQAQREIFLNQAFCLLDSLMTRAVTAALDAPPADPAEGACYRVLDEATGEWSGRDRSIAVRIGGGWHFVPPQAGMQVFDRAARCWYHFEGDWTRAVQPPAPEGGTVIDQEARDGLMQLIAALRNIGLLSPDSA
ncbi:DUF2793 domain-containing protein [Erythrobacter sp. HL-111]|uniref:DUF2793 domain-containing protein n=1 Tax=Erythrobacter sp. HL-111 TaxID=1798193 RepID=UPI0006DBC75B|nr:DUF2793 domain-containing protein [Erythrobacter sp. HL-111]KPP94117.1 MAG: Protein of unknown function (DUF2793) [Erythrobacteraceae bacterium HL-111]SDS63349.1 Protein of unknown function [Erythrobacter sp. HL-111]